MTVALAPWPLLLVAQTLAPDTRPAPATLKTGESVTGTLTVETPALPGLGRGLVYGFAAESAGPVTIRLESFDFDAFLRIETESRESVVQDGDGGVEWNARAILDPSPGTRYRILAGANSVAGIGEFTLSIGPGATSPLSGEALHAASVAFRHAAAGRALARGDERVALAHLKRECNLRLALSQFREARPVLDEMLRLARGLGDLPTEAGTLQNLSCACRELGEPARAVEFERSALEIFRALGDRAGEGRSLGNLGVLHGWLGRPAEGIALIERCLSIARDVKDRGMEARACGQLGSLYLTLGDASKARGHHERGLAISQDIPDRPAETLALANLVDVYQTLGEFGRALEASERQISLALEIGDKSLQAKGLDSMVGLRMARGEYGKAREVNERCLTLSRDLGDRVGEFEAIYKHAAIAYLLGRYAEARDLYREDLSLSEAMGMRGNMARASSGLGYVALELGDPREAIEHSERALAWFREVGSRDGEAGELAFLGNVAYALGDYPAAARAMEEALRLFEELGNRRARATFLQNLGIIRIAARDIEGARRCFEEALTLAGELGDRMEEARALGHLGLVHSALKDYAKAKEEFGRWRDHARETGARDMEACALSNLAKVHSDLGEDEEAEALARATLEIRRAMGSEETSLQALEVLASAALRKRDAASLRTVYGEADAVLDRISAHAPGADEALVYRSGLSAWGIVAEDATALGAETAADARERAAVVAEGFRRAGKWKGRTLLEGIAEHRAGSRTAEVVRLRRERKEALAGENRVLERLSEAIQQQREPEELENLRTEARSLGERANELLASLRDVSPKEASIDRPPAAGPETVRPLLGSRTALIEFSEGSDRYFAYVLTAADLAFLDLGERGSMHGDVAEYFSYLESPELVVVPAELAEKGRALFDRLLAPALRAAGDSIERLVLVPTSCLAGFPFEALVAGTREGAQPRSFADLEFVLDRYEVSYAPSSPVLVELASLGRRKAEGRLLVLADPAYRVEDARAAGGEEVSLASARVRGAPVPGRLARLEKTRNEAFALARALSDPEAVPPASLKELAEKRSGSLSSGRLDLHLGTEASRRRLAGDLKPYSVLHLAAHAFVDREQPRRSGVALAPEEGETGFFTIADAMDLDLDADLVVLSGCETARGEVRRGEGIESMARAFLYAGARGVVASLWEVEDRASAETMEAFYRGWSERGLPSSRSLREAKLAIRRSRELRESPVPGGAPIETGHPFFWAPFIYIGLPR